MVIHDYGAKYTTYHKITEPENGLSWKDLKYDQIPKAAMGRDALS